MRRSSNFKFYRETVFGYLLAFLCLFGSYAMYIESSFSLDKAARRCKWPPNFSYIKHNFNVNEKTTLYNCLGHLTGRIWVFG